MSGVDLLYLREEVLELPWQDASLVVLASILSPVVLALDRVSLSGSCLTIGKNGAVVTLETEVNDGLSEFQEHLFLSDVLTSDEVKCELLL